MKRLSTHQDWDMVTGVSVVDKLALRMESELIISKHPMFKCSSIFQTGVSMRRREEEELELQNCKWKLRLEVCTWHTCKRQPSPKECFQSAPDGTQNRNQTWSHRIRQGPHSFVTVRVYFSFMTQFFQGCTCPICRCCFSRLVWITSCASFLIFCAALWEKIVMWNRAQVSCFC